MMLSKRLACFAALLPLISFCVDWGPVRNYPNIGLMFPILRHAKADPLPLPEAHPYVLVEGDELSREDLFNPFDLWYAMSCCARWFDVNGNRLTLGRMTHQYLPSSEEFVSREDFAAWMESSSAPLDPREAESRREWAAGFSGLELGKGESPQFNSFAINQLVYYPCSAQHVLVYAFQPRLSGAGKTDWFCVVLEAPGAKDREQLKAAFETQFIGSIAIPSRTSRDEGSAVEELALSKRESRPIDLPDHPVRLEARKSIENYDAWWIAETEGYVILSDVDSATGKTFVRDLQNKMPALRKAFTRLVPPLTRKPDISVLRIFQMPEDYVRYVGKELAWSTGAWLPARRELVLMQSPDAEAWMRILQHEAFHQYLSAACCMITAPPWMNEGHAVFFEHATVTTKGKVSFEEAPMYVSLLLENMESLSALIPTFLACDYTTFYAGTDVERQLKYALAWGIVYYLQKAAPQERNTPFKKVLPNLMEALATTRRYAVANEQTLEKIDLPVFQSNFSEFWLKRRGTALQYDPLD